MQMCGNRAKPLLLRLRGNHRQVHLHRGAVTDFALGLDGPAMQLRDMFDNRKTKPGPAKFPMTRLIGPIKPLKNSRQIARRDSRPVVGHTQADRFTVCAARGRQFVRPAPSISTALSSRL